MIVYFLKERQVVRSVTQSEKEIRRTQVPTHTEREIRAMDQDVEFGTPTSYL